MILGAVKEEGWLLLPGQMVLGTGAASWCRQLKTGGRGPWKS